MLYRYEQAVLSSLQDVEDALVAYAKERRRRDALADAVGQNQRSVVLSRDLYVHGLGTYLAVLDAQRAEYATEDSLVQSDQAVVEALISTYKALGGGWDQAVEVAREGGVLSHLVPSDSSSRLDHGIRAHRRS